MKKLFLETITILGFFFLFILITFGVWIYFRGTQPIDIPDSRGITFWQLIQERWAAWGKANAKVSAQPQYAGCRNNITAFFWMNVRSAWNYTYASLTPNSKLTEAFHYWEVNQPDPILPVVETILWYQAPDAFWKYFLMTYWRGLVSADGLADECQLGPVNYAAILGAGRK
jgi:hypothetical protein